MKRAQYRYKGSRSSILGEKLRGGDPLIETGPIKRSGNFSPIQIQLCNVRFEIRRTYALPQGLDAPYRTYNVIKGGYCSEEGIIFHLTFPTASFRRKNYKRIA